MDRSYREEPVNLEASLLQMINDHNHASTILRERTGQLYSTEFVIEP